MKVLVVGYGNPLRHDDAVGLWVAERLCGVEGVETHSAWPLTPDLIPRVAAADLVIFVDAEAHPGPIRWRRLRPRPSKGLTHALDPEELLWWAGVIFGHSPRAWLVTIPGRDFSWGEGLSSPTERAAERLIRRIKRLLAESF